MLSFIHYNYGKIDPITQQKRGMANDCHSSQESDFDYIITNHYKVNCIYSW